jgi:DNA-directed RNA polymerase subunit RPC12/RpoP
MNTISEREQTFRPPNEDRIRGIKYKCTRCHREFPDPEDVKDGLCLSCYEREVRQIEKTYYPGEWNK